MALYTYAKGSDLVADSLLETKLNGMMGFVIPGMQIKKVHDRKPEDLLKEALDLAKNSDVVIAALGENANMNGEGASRSILIFLNRRWNFSNRWLPQANLLYL